MTPLEFFISVKNSEAKNGLQEVQQKVDGFKASTDELYQGPAREMRIRTEIKGIVQDIAMGQSPLTAFLNSMERLSEMGKFAGGLAAMVALLAGIVIVEVKAEKATMDLMRALKKVLDVDINTASSDQLKELGRQIEAAEDQARNATWLQKLINWAGGRDVLGETLTVLYRRKAQANDKLDDNLAAETEAAAELIRYKGNKEKEMAAEIAEVQKKYRKLEDDEIDAGRYANASALSDKMFAEIAAIKLAQVKADDEVAARKAAHTAELQKQLDRAAAAAASAGENSARELSARYAQLQQDIDAATDPDKKMELEIEQEGVKKQMAEEALRGRQEEREAEKTAESATAKLKREIVRAQFEMLDKEDQNTVKRAALANLEKEIKTGAVTGDDALRAQLEVMKLKKELADAEKKTSPWGGIDAENALRGNMASGSFGRVTNDAANRSEKHLETMSGYLKTIASRGAAGDVEALFGG